MFEFLLAILIAAFGQAAPEHPDFTPDVIVEKIEEKIEGVSAPQLQDELQLESSTATSSPLLNLETSIENPQATPDTTKVEAYNTQSEKVIGSVAQVAIEKAPPLEPVPTPTPESTEPTNFIPLPIPAPICSGFPSPNGHQNNFNPPVCPTIQI